MGAASFASMPLNLLRSMAGCASADPLTKKNPMSKPNHDFLVSNLNRFSVKRICFCTGLQICMKFGGNAIFFNFIDGKCISLQHGMVGGNWNRFGFYG